jgi:hypothetical protein
MHRGSLTRVVVVLVSALGAPALSANERAVTLRVGTLGFSLEAATSLNGKVGVRAGGSLFSLGATETESDITYDVDLKLRSLAGYVDFHPTEGAFRLTAGLVYNKNRIEATAVPTSGTFEVDDVTYEASQVGTLEGVGRFGSRTLAPYLGLGFGSARGESRVFVAFDLGVVFQGSPTVDLSATGPLASNAQFQSDLQSEEAQANEELAEPLLRYYPVLSLGIGVRF